MRRFSPAPWEFITDEGGEENIIMDGDHKINIGNIEDTCDRCYANGYLIEQAPIMYELLMEIYSDIPLGGDFNERIQSVIKRVEV